MNGTPFPSPVALWRRLSPLGWLLAANVAVFLAQSVAQVWFKSGGVLEYWFGLSADGLLRGWVWTPLTYAFLHEGFWHIVLNMLVLVFSWRPVAAEIGERSCLWSYLACVLGGAALWLAVSGSGDPSQELVGASAGAFGIFALFCFFYWESPVTFLLFFILPLTVKPKWILLLFGGTEVFSMLFRELPQRLGMIAGRPEIAFSAHVGGLLAAAGCFFFLRRDGWASRKRAVELPAWLRSPRGRVRASAPCRVNFADPAAVNRKELDRILDKIAAHGFASLTPQERAWLDGAHEALRRRDEGPGPRR